MGGIDGGQVASGGGEAVEPERGTHLIIHAEAPPVGWSVHAWAMVGAQAWPPLTACGRRAKGRRAHSRPEWATCQECVRLVLRARRLMELPAPAR